MALSGGGNNDPAQWKVGAQLLAAKHSAVTTLDRVTLRSTLVELNALFLEAPTSIQKAYRSMSERRIVRAYDDFANRLTDGSLAWSVPDSPEKIAEVLGGLIRAVDWTLVQRENKCWTEPGEWLVDDLWFVIPRMGLSATRPPSRNQAYEKRGLRFHRIIPTKIDRFRVNVVPSRTHHRSASDHQTWKMGACLFEGLKLNPDIVDDEGQEKHFVVLSADCPSASASVKSQIEDALNADCIALVWPELTVPPAIRREIQETLNARDMVDGREGPEVVVTGSWHEETEKDRVVNRAHIYDGYGVERLVYDKIQPYADDDWGIENIEPGDTISILASEAALIGFAICLDFCDVVSNPFTELDLDIVLIPSMGNDRTMQGHQTTASRVEVKFGTRCFVVQQTTSTKSNDRRIGTILPLLKEPNGVSVADLGQMVPWKSYLWPT
ncbi:hypothetical protein [Bradyrhizobium sp. CCBAU 51753]|uniref:hypothetical protein n=1 Tax=Bradyrhizobium sp. CCBAU 51753 TaxID=1325100 RepID=UPI00188C8340|nr:hypothetical protein [Bradyrhizobium sp. CCBAU 51753]